MKWRPRIGALVVACGVLGLAAAMAAAEGFRGYLAVSAGQMVAEENADHLFVPASVQKLLVAAAALDALGEEHVLRTVVRARGEVSNGQLEGDLVVEAGGDPTWSRTFRPDDPEAPLAELAASIADRGVERVTGDLVIDVSAFPGRRFHPDRPLVELGVALGAPTAAIALHDNVFEIVIRPGLRPGEPAHATSVEPIAIDNRMVSVGKARHGKGSVEFFPSWGRDEVVVRGEYPVSEGSYRVRVAVPSPESWVGGKLLDHLRAAGVEIAGEVVVQYAASSADGPVLAEVATPLVDLFEPILSDSTNWLAAMLLQAVALEVTGQGRLDDGIETVATFLTDDVGVDDSSFSLRDASGLSPTNLVSPRTVVAVLSYAMSSKWGPTLLGNLAAPGSGTLAGWPVLPVVAAKTGTIRNSLALAGVIEPGTADPVVFAIFLNHDTRPLARRRREVAALVRSWVAP
ncbi:MAG: D-alanyl-D-alanine carboxypeptidase/D-alanyl-D-alanine-endopeptidase [Acidobacteriota bacterium]|nr:D-alanyl-D-alanine carboxypeptidase/D-alanyl-D-alanine-endopeptidase [Acidobacteriota bacterium]